MPNRVARVTYTEEIVRDAVRTYIWRRVVANKRLWMSQIALAASAIWLIWTGDTGWRLGAVGVLLLLFPIVTIAAWIAHHRNTVGKFRKMRSPQADFTFLDDEFEVASELGAARIPWAAITELWERPAYWMMFTAPSQFMTLPVQTISPADQTFLRSRMLHCAMND